jgi:pimeloyl-ACP methyl ester carboxylesterase
MANQLPLHRLQINGAELHYADQGSGTPLVLVHGSLSDWRTWRGQIEPLAQHYRVIAYSRRYHYPNEWRGDGTDYTAAQHVEDLAALIDALALGPIHLLASSYGAYLSLLFARRDPARVRSLVLGEPPILSWLAALPGGKPLLDEFSTNVWGAARRAFGSGDPAQGVRLFTDAVLGTNVFDQLPPSARASLMANAPELEAETRSPDLFPGLECEAVRQITIPSLLLNGERSPAMFHLITEELARCLPHAERATIPNASHNLHHDNPTVYNKAVLDFLARQHHG